MSENERERQQEGAGFGDDRPSRRARRGNDTGTANTVADKVAAIVSAAEETAERLLQRTEDRVRDRIAEGERAAENRVRAAEEEATELLESALGEAPRVP